MPTFPNNRIEWQKNVLYPLQMTTIALKRRSDLHLSRKLWHTLGVLALLTVYMEFSRRMSLEVLGSATAVFVSLDVLRKFSKRLNHFLTLVFRPFMREHERHGLAGTTYLLLGVFIIISLFPKPVCILSLLFLAVADPLASLVGILYGKDKICGPKSLQGTSAAFSACTVIAAIFFYCHHLMVDRLVIVSLLAGLIGAVSELIPIFNIDDNLTFPVVSSSFLHALFWLFGGF